jgi:hypothetical protein
MQPARRGSASRGPARRAGALHCSQGCGSGRPLFSPRHRLDVALFDQVTETVQIGLQFLGDHAPQNGWFH